MNDRLILGIEVSSVILSQQKYSKSDAWYLKSTKNKFWNLISDPKPNKV